uniref:G_PROTEIN_RECEP_F1_2 domain-containing protein n=1 Tax=Panagrellus redivivus TaxID=6233 RepID=A0A7E4USK2_PANRE
MTDDACAPGFTEDHRWYLVAVLGTTLSVISLFCNSLTALILLKKRYAHFFFLGLLAASDTFLSLCYGPVIAMDAIINRLHIVWLAQGYRYYVLPLLALCHVSMTFSCLMIILGSIERYLITVKSAKLGWWRRHRMLLAFAMMLLALFLRGTEIVEYTHVKNEDCVGLTEYTPMTTDIVQDYLYGTVFRFYLRNILTVFVPFILLAYLNIRVVNTLRSQQRSATMFRFGSSEHKLKIRSATRLLVLVVFSYLIANFLNVVVTAWEYIDFDSTQEFFALYEVITDIISVLYIFTCATRLGVYVACNEELRKAYYEHICCCAHRPYSTQLSLEAKNASKTIADENGSANLMHLSSRGTDFDRIALAIASGHVASPNEDPRDLQSFVYIDSNGQTNGTVVIENPCVSYHNWSTDHAVDNGDAV